MGKDGNLTDTTLVHSSAEESDSLEPRFQTHGESYVQWSTYTFEIEFWVWSTAGLLFIQQLVKANSIQSTMENPAKLENSRKSILTACNLKGKTEWGGKKMGKWVKCDTGSIGRVLQDSRGNMSGEQI